MSYKGSGWWVVSGGRGTRRMGVGVRTPLLPQEGGERRLLLFLLLFALAQKYQ
jgi:hypothetical protein